MKTFKVSGAHIRSSLPSFHRSLIDIVSVVNRPEQDAKILRMAGLSLERALFPLLVLVEKFGPIGVVDLAGRVGRNYTTVSRQLERLKELGLIARRSVPGDRRICEAVITPRGKRTTDAVDAARERFVLALFRDWSRSDFDELVRLMRMLADGLNETSASVE